MTPPLWQKVNHSDLSELRGNDSETTCQTHQKEGQSEGKTSAHGYIQYIFFKFYLSYYMDTYDTTLRQKVKRN